MERLVAPLTVQASVTEPPPAGRLLGVAVKLAMVGALLLLLEQPANAKLVNRTTTTVLIETIRVHLKEGT
jgi:hypothetical protein